MVRPFQLFGSIRQTLATDAISTFAFAQQELVLVADAHLPIQNLVLLFE